MTGNIYLDVLSIFGVLLLPMVIVASVSFNQRASEPFDIGND